MGRQLYRDSSRLGAGLDKRVGNERKSRCAARLRDRPFAKKFAARASALSGSNSGCERGVVGGVRFVERFVRITIIRLM